MFTWVHNMYYYITFSFSTSFHSNRFVQNCWISNKRRMPGSTLPVSWYAILRGIANIGVVANYSFAQVCNYHPSLLSHAWSCFRLMFFWSADQAKRSSDFLLSQHIFAFPEDVYYYTGTANYFYVHVLKLYDIQRHVYIHFRMSMAVRVRGFHHFGLPD